MHRLRRILNPEWWRFEWRYRRYRTPWDTQVTPPEVMTFIQENRPGRALDLGCGTGTNAVTLARHGWQTTGVDFSTRAVATARAKAARQNLEIDFYVGDVSDLSFLTKPFDYVLDIGCLFTLSAERRSRYAGEVSRLQPPGAAFMLYAWLPQQRRGRRLGLCAQAVADLFQTDFMLIKSVQGKDGPGDSAWYWFRRK